MTRIEGEIVIDRPVGEVFDFVADERNEPRFNARMTRAELVSNGPIGVGTRFRAETAGPRRPVPMTIEVTGFDRPRRLASSTQMPTMDIDGALTFEPVGDATRMRWEWELKPHGALRLASPAIARIGSRREREIWDGLKRLLEAPAPPPARAHDRRAALADFARCVRAWAGLVLRRQLASPKSLVSEHLHLADGTSSLIFRETARTGAPTRDPVLLVIQFRLAFLGSNRLLHAAFRRECMLHTPLFAGFPGFRSKLWVDDLQTGIYRGIYEWQGAGAAHHYARRMVGLLAPFSTPGTARYEVLEGVRRDDFLACCGLLRTRGADLS